MKTLFLAWQDTSATRAWYPIGRLDADVSGSHYSFAYTGGAQTAHAKAGLEPLDAFPNFYRRYEATELFPLFRNRVMGEDRKDFEEYLRQLDLSPTQASPLEILAVTGGERQTDNLQVFPKIDRHADGRFQCRFFLHGSRHVNQAAQEKLAALQEGTSLGVSIELNNPVTINAVQLLTPDDYHMIGWAPRYLVNDLFEAMAESPRAIQAKIIKVNPAPAPTKQRLLIELTGMYPEGYEPMSTSEFLTVREVE